MFGVYIKKSLNLKYNYECLFVDKVIFGFKRKNNFCSGDYNID